MWKAASGSPPVKKTSSSDSLIYAAIIARRLDSDFINLGFGGSAKAEPAIMDYIAGLDMSVFVYDYDHNAPDAEYLKNTHYEGYRRFRAAQPDTPVIMASKVDYHSDAETNETRRRIVMESYKRGLEAGGICISWTAPRFFLPIIGMNAPPTAVIRTM